MPDHTPQSAEPAPIGSNGAYTSYIPPGALNGIAPKIAPALRERFRIDPAMEIPGMPPNFGQPALPHVMTLQGLVSTVSRCYRISDEALNDSFDHARFMEYDLGIWECIEARTRTVSLLDWHLEPEDDNDQEQIACCDKLKRIIESIPRFMQVREQLLLAIWYGRSAVSMRYGWGQCGRDWYVMPIEDMNGDMAWTPVHGDKLVFRLMDGRLDHLQNQVGVRVGQTYNIGDRILKQQLNNDGYSVSTHWQVESTDRGLAYFLTPDERKLFIIHKHQIQDSAFERPTDAGRVHGVGIRSRLYWEWFQKQNTLQWLMEYIERSSFGLELWFYPLGNEKARADAETAVKNRVGPFRNVLFVPVPPDDGSGQQYGVQHVETGLAGADLLLQMVEKFFGHRIKRLILGQVLTSEAEATGLGGNLANIHLLTFRDIVKYDAINLSETLTQWLNYSIKPWNFPNSGHFQVKFCIDTEPIDSDSKMAALEKAYGMGARIKESDVFEAIGASAPGPTDRILPPPGGSGGGMGQIPGGGPQNDPQTPKTPLGQAAQDAFDEKMGKNEPDVGGKEKGESGRPDVHLHIGGNGEQSQYAEDRWITIGAKDGDTGTHVKIGGDGKIEVGPAKLEGEKISQLSSNKRLKKETTKNKPFKISTEGDTESLLRSISSGVGKKLTQSDAIKMSGAPDGAKVVVRDMGGDSLEIEWQADGMSAIRTLYPDKTVFAVSFGVDENKKGKGLGARMLAKMVDESSARGMVKILTEAWRADGEEGETSLNGYYTWPRLGYDGGLPTSWRNKHQEELKELGLGESRKVSDLMKSDSGRNFWKNKGVSLSLEFDLSENSQSRKVLNAYIASKG